jgi:RNA polymerase sigma-70 factor (ECF subfamily)
MALDPADAEIVELAMAGGRAKALRLFHDRHGARLAAACRRIAGSAGDGDDLCQEALIQIDRSLPSFRGESQLYSWAFKIALHLGLNRRRGLERRTPHVGIEEGAGRLAAGEREGGDPDLSCLATFRGWVVERALLDLPEGQRLALTLHDLEEMTAAEAGALLGIEANAVKQRVHRARRSLRERIASEFARRGVDLDGVGVEGCVSGLFGDEVVAADAPRLRA